MCRIAFDERVERDDRLTILTRRQLAAHVLDLAAIAASSLAASRGGLPLRPQPAAQADGRAPA